ncbi:unnamed protein product [Pleuronectes platessa]|uniref:Uncharacterized protein n=1 Tax=Pleuronectes platessa TaxID=8262 RepID=A0A9N7VTF4_PLEPL|nr:unnamed protein product [Pleuronectes platessa]
MSEDPVMHSESTARADISPMAQPSVPADIVLPLLATLIYQLSFIRAPVPPLFSVHAAAVTPRPGPRIGEVWGGADERAGRCEGWQDALGPVAPSPHHNHPTSRKPSVPPKKWYRRLERH